MLWRSTSELKELRRSSLRPQRSEDTLENEAGITDADAVLRWVKTPQHLGYDPDQRIYVTSERAWSTQRPGGCSVEMVSLIEEAGVSIDNRLEVNNAVLAAEIKVGDVRGTMNRRDVKGKNPHEPLQIAYTPIPDGAQHGPNPFHCDIFPPLAGNGKSELARKAVIANQLAAEALYRIKHGLGP